jgi:excisionase family DNA binding protein
MADHNSVLGQRLLRVSEVAFAMRISTMTVYRLIKGGQLDAIRVGKNYRIRAAELDRYLRDGVVGAETPATRRGSWR